MKFATNNKRCINFNIGYVNKTIEEEVGITKFLGLQIDNNLNKKHIEYTVVPRCMMPSIFDISINNPPPIGSHDNKFSINDVFMMSHGPQFWPVGAFLGGLSRPQPVSDDPFYDCLGLSWLPFQCLMCVAFNMYFLSSINDNFN
jgi:hypothetical protein